MKAKTKAKPRIGIFALTSCFGCQMRVLDLEEALPELIEHLDIVSFHLLKEDNEFGSFDVAFIEGAVTTKEDAKRLKIIRENSKYLIALGTCATFGGLPSIRDFGYQQEIMKAVYADPTIFGSIDVTGIGQYVDVDYYIRGCPIDKTEFLKVVKYLLVGNIPRHIEYPVCLECRLNENKCLLQEGELCMGPITYGGCKAPCTTNKFPCYGCRGPLEDGNVEELVELFRDKGVTRDDLERMFVKFAGTSKKFANLEVLKNG